jgi:nucleoside 2-deoxyribosyltransferase
MIHVVGGVYLERCLEPNWNEVYGSAGRAAVALASVSDCVILHTRMHEDLKRQFGAVAESHEFKWEAAPSEQIIGFAYTHCLSTPFITPRAIKQEVPLEVAAEVILRFGMMESTAIVHGNRVVYDPQAAESPQPFHRNASTAAHLAVVVNGYELKCLTGTADLRVGARQLLEEGAEVVVVKMASRGCLVIQAAQEQAVPAYRSDFVWSIGSGDVFAAAFAHFWGEMELDPAVAADLASRSTACYCNTMSLPLRPASQLMEESLAPLPQPTGLRKVYLAGPFFNLTQRWLVEEARSQLLAQHLAVFSPLHDIGPGPAEIVAEADLEGLKGCDRVLALVDGGDVGTIFEVGYANALKIPVVAFSQNTPNEDLKMLSGTGCVIVEDFVTAIYRTSWISGSPQ